MFPVTFIPEGFWKQRLCIVAGLFSPQIHSGIFLLVPWLRKGSWGSVCFLQCTTSLNFDFYRSPSQYKWKIRFVCPFFFLWFSCNGSLKESLSFPLKGESGKHFSSSCLILYIWTTSAIPLSLLDNSLEKLKNYLFMIISFLSAFLKNVFNVWSTPAGITSKICSRENNSKAKTMTNSIQTREGRSCSAAIINQVSTCLRCLWKLPDKLMGFMVCPEDEEMWAVSVTTKKEGG